MNFWQFLDRNGFGVAVVIVIALCFAFGTCGATNHGCRIKAGCGEVSVGAATDGGAP